MDEFRQNQVFIYAFDKLSRVPICKHLTGNDITVANMKWLANQMYRSYPGIEAIYAIDNRRGLGKYFWDACKSADFTLHIEFRDMVERSGLCLLKVKD